MAADRRGLSPEKKYWMKLNNQGIVYFEVPLNPGFVFWLRRAFRAHVFSDGGERVTVTRREPFTDAELRDIYLETEHRQQVVSTRPRTRESRR